MMHPAFALLANRSLQFGWYDFHLSGVSARELAAAYHLPFWVVEERLEAVRLCLKYQVKLGLASPQTQGMTLAARIPAQACTTGSANAIQVGT